MRVSKYLRGWQLGFQNTCGDGKYVEVVLPLCKSVVIEYVFVVVRSQKGVVPHHLVTKWYRWSGTGRVQGVGVGLGQYGELVRPLPTRYRHVKHTCPFELLN